MNRFAGVVLAAGAIGLLIDAGCGPSTKCTNECPKAGATQCFSAGVETCEKHANSCLGWSVPAPCPTGQSCQGDACTCAIPCGTACCGAGSACIDNACCAAPCGTSCGCPTGAVCAVDTTGAKSCSVECIVNSQCSGVSAATPCCGIQPDGGAACIPQPSATSNDFVCLCLSANDCPTTNSCSPDTPQGESGPYVCSPVNGRPNAGCSAFTPCTTTGDDCWTDIHGNEFCTKSCTTGVDCPVGSTCEMGNNASCSNLGGTCSAPGACMPSP